MYGDVEVLTKQAADEAAKFGVIALHVVFEPHCFKYIHDAAGKVFVDNKDSGVMGREWTISDINEHYDYNAATMLTPTNDDFNFDFSFSQYYHVLYTTDNFINLESDAVEGIKSWRFTAGGTSSQAVGRAGAGGGLGYSFRSQPHVCFCGANPCPHVDFTGRALPRLERLLSDSHRARKSNDFSVRIPMQLAGPTEHKVLPCTQQKADREQATNFFESIKEDTPLASAGAVGDSTSGNEVLWLSIAKDTLQIANEKFTAAGGTGASGTRTISTGWAYVEIEWLVKIKTDSDGNVHYEAETLPHVKRAVTRTTPRRLFSLRLLCVSRSDLLRCGSHV